MLHGAHAAWQIVLHVLTEKPVKGPSGVSGAGTPSPRRRRVQSCPLCTGEGGRGGRDSFWKVRSLECGQGEDRAKHTHVRKHIHMFTGMHMHTCTCIASCTCTRMHICAHVRAHPRTHVHIHIHITHVHTHTSCPALANWLALLVASRKGLPPCGGNTGSFEAA